MKRLRIRLTDAAKASLRAIGRHTEAEWGKAKRNAYLRDLDVQFNALSEQPAKGRRRDELALNLRSYVQGSHVIFYVAEEKQLLIVDVLHSRMDPIEYL